MVGQFFPPLLELLLLLMILTLLVLRVHTQMGAMESTPVTRTSVLMDTFETMLKMDANVV